MLARNRIPTSRRRIETGTARATCLTHSCHKGARAAISNAYDETAAPLSRRFTTLCVEIRGELRRAELLSAALWLGFVALAGTCVALAFA